jgi:hypothetical protein
MWGTRAQGATLAGLVTSASLMAGLALAQNPQNPFAGECNRTATQEEVDGARGAHQAAKQFYERAEYARAIQYWRDVFNFDCNAIGTLINIANAYERLGDRQNAIFALEAYIKRVPEGTDVSKIEARVQNLKELQAQAASSASAAPSATAATSSTTPPPPTSATTPPIMVKPHGVAPFVTVGIGAAAVVVGAIMIPIGKGNVDDAGCSASGKPGVGWCNDQAAVDLATSGNTTIRAGSVVLGIGAAAVVGGLAWEFLANAPAPQKSDKPATGRVRFSPTFGPGMNGAVVHGTF